MKVKIGVVEKHYYTGVRQLEDIDLEKFPLIKQFMEVNPGATEEDLLKYLKKIKYIILNCLIKKNNLFAYIRFIICLLLI